MVQETKKEKFILQCHITLRLIWQCILLASVKSDETNFIDFPNHLQCKIYNISDLKKIDIHE